jgi:hypothetical protein
MEESEVSKPQVTENKGQGFLDDLQVEDDEPEINIPKNSVTKNSMLSTTKVLKLSAEQMIEQIKLKQSTTIYVLAALF